MEIKFCWLGTVFGRPLLRCATFFQPAEQGEQTRIAPAQQSAGWDISDDQTTGFNRNMKRLPVSGGQVHSPEATA